MLEHPAWRVRVVLAPAHLVYVVVRSFRRTPFASALDSMTSSHMSLLSSCSLNSMEVFSKRCH